MRTAFTLLAIWCATFFFGPIVMIAALFRVRDRPGSVYERCMRAWAKTVLWAAGVEVRVHGSEYLAREGGAVYVSNHVSWFDVFALAAVLPRCTFVAKLELRRIFLFGPAAEAVGIVFLDRTNRKSAVESIKRAAPAVREGRPILACPEGTRGHDYRLRPFKKGPFVLAIAAQTRVIPVVVYGAREVMPRDTFRIRSGTIEVHALPAVPTEGLAYEDRHRLMTEVWESMADLLLREHGVDSGAAGGAVVSE